MSGENDLRVYGVGYIRGGSLAGGGSGGGAVLGREYAGGVQITPGVIRATVDAVLAEVGAYSSSTSVALIAADRLCVAAGRRVGRDERADLEGACLGVLSEE